MKPAITIDFLGLDKRLRAVEDLLPKGDYILTLVCRYVGKTPLDADVVLTADDLNRTIETIERYKNRPPRYNAGEHLK